LTALGGAFSRAGVMGLSGGGGAGLTGAGSRGLTGSGGGAGGSTRDCSEIRDCLLIANEIINVLYLPSLTQISR